MYKAKNKKKAFTLTELLVVVIVIGVLSAAVLPKFNKVIETRKTTEAEELMASIRTEQEKRCALDKPYLVQMSELTDIVKKDNTKNYAYTLENKGIIASSKGNYSYNLQMPSYADGRICCSGNDCEKLNKNYPKCEGFNYEPSPDSCAGEIAPTEPEVKECSGSATQSCGCQGKGTQSRTCNTTTGQWSAWGTCSVSDSCECTGEKKDRQACTSGNTCGFETRTATCDATTGEWQYGSWNKNSCSAQPTKTSQSCSSCGGTQSISYTCNKDSGVWEQTLGDCDKPEEECEECVPGREVVYDYNGEDTCNGDSTNKWTQSLAVLAGEKFECYDVYEVGSGGSSGGGCPSDAPPVCTGGTVRRCINGQWKCQNPMYDDCNHGGPCNEIGAELGNIGLVRVEVAKVTVCGRGLVVGPVIGGEIIDKPVKGGCSSVGGSCTSCAGGPGVWIEDAMGSCCCETVCTDLPNGVQCAKCCVQNELL